MLFNSVIKNSCKLKLLLLFNVIHSVGVHLYYLQFSINCVIDPL